MAKLCPHCLKSTQFQAVVSHPAVVDYAEADVKVVQESTKFMVTEVRKCMGCAQAVSEAQLVEADYCADTKALYPVTELLDYQGRKLSKPAHALATRQELQGLSQHDLIAKLLELEAATGKAPVKAAAEEVVAAAEETAAGSEQN